MGIKKKLPTVLDNYKFTFKVNKGLKVKAEKKEATKLTPTPNEPIRQEKSKIFSMSYFREVYADYLINQIAQT